MRPQTWGGRIGPPLLCLFLTLCCCAQTPVADDLVARGRKIHAEGNSRDALPLFERALALYADARDRRNEAAVLGFIGNCYRRFGDYPRALEYHNKALALKRELGDRAGSARTLSTIGLIYWDQSNYPPAIDHLTRAITIARETADRAVEAAALNNLSLVYDELGDYRRSMEGYRRALELQRAAGAEDMESQTLGNIGGVHLLLGQYRDAMRYYQQSLAISERLKLKASMSLDLGNLAHCHAGMGQVSEALSTFDRALALARESGDKKAEADWRRGKGSALARAGRYPEAREEYAAANGVYQQANLKRELVEGLNDAGSLHLLLGDAASAERDFRRAIEVAREINHPRGITTNLLALGDVEWRRRRYEQAAALYGSVIERARQAGDQGHLAAAHLQLAATLRDQGRLDESRLHTSEGLKVAREAGAKVLEASALHLAGDVARLQRRFPEALQLLAEAQAAAEATADPENSWRVAFAQGKILEASGRDSDAVAAYERAIRIIESIRNQLREERFRAGYLEDKWQVYDAIVRLLLKLKRNDEAFQFGERLRASNYLDLIHRGDTLPLAEARAREAQELRQRIRQLQRAVTQESTAASPRQRVQAVSIFSSELSAAERAYQELLDDMRSRDPRSAALLQIRVPSSAEVREKLPAGAALVEYLAGENQLAIFVVTAQALRATTVPVRAADLRAKVELFRDLVISDSTQDWLPPAQSLRQLLVQPLEAAGWLKGIEKLYVVPHGTLHYLPFAALPRQHAGGPRFLVEDYELTYLPAAAMLVQKGSAAGSGASLLAVAPTRSRLRFAQEEARGIAASFGGRPALLMGADATESSFKRDAGAHRVIHLATHGYFNRLNPLFSGVELEPDRTEDGRLEVHEILGLRLKASLVTLSACETALGSGYFVDLPAGDDFIGLTRAFMFAGAASVLATLWEVNDRSTMDLMRGFYRRLAQEGKAASLAQAQRATLRMGSARLKHPYHWAGFVLVGERN